jgi:hypothetical protein
VIISSRLRGSTPPKRSAQSFNGSRLPTLAMSFETIARRIGLGKIALYLYHRPIALVRHSWRNGGPIVQFNSERQRREMEESALQLGSLPRYAGPRVSLHLMTGRKFWYQTLFCLHSFARAAEINVDVELYDDGTIDDQVAARLLQAGPSVRLHSIKALQEKRRQLLPPERYPVLNERWKNYPNIRKLIDVHLGSQGWKLVIDSDLLFFRRPKLLVEWLLSPSQALVAQDCEESYGYSRALLEDLSGAPIPSLVNVGLCGLRSENIDWDLLERWTAELHRREKTSYYLEQALVAQMMSRQSFIMAPGADYITMPSRAEVDEPRGIMHHYVMNSKRWYFTRGWRHIL